MDAIEIRPITDISEMGAVEEIQLLIWGKNEREIMAGHVLHALQFNGAALFGAYDGTKLVGFTLAVLATVEDLNNRIDQVAAARLKMYSVIAGVLPEYRNANVGYRLKLAQRDFALRIGVRLITWTYDPLESRNGRFNIGKLGAVCHRYHRNFHGDLVGINAGLATDRFEVEWWVTSNRVKGRIARKRKPLSLQSLVDGGALLVNEATFSSAGLPIPPANYVSRSANLILMEIPADFQTIKEEDFSLALRWRQHSQLFFEELFYSGFMVTDFVGTTDEDGHRRSFYLLTHQDA
jgi:predicted GNAT superfamily acetyltransferase